MQYATRTTLKRPKMVLHFPPIYLLPTHLPLESLHALEDQIPTLTYDITEAKVVVGKVTTKQRAQFELRSRKIWTQEIVRQESEVKFDESDGRRIAQDQPRKRRRLGDRPSTIDVIVIDSSTESEEAETSWKPTERDLREELKSTQSQIQRSSLEPLITIPPAVDSQSSASTAQDSQTIQEPDDVIKVVKLSWFIDSLAADGVLPTDNYLVYEGRKIPRPNMPSEPIITKTIKRAAAEDILARAKTDAPKRVSGPSSGGTYTKSASHRQPQSQAVTRPTYLLHESTSEHDKPAKLPPVPDYLHTTYSCQRPTPLSSLDDPFIAELKKIKLTRILTGDEIGVRAYSTSIASLAAYPYTLTSPREILHLPGCDQKIALLYQEWKDTGHIRAVDELTSDARLQVLNLFYEIWGVGATTARDFYARGWRDLDDVVEFGWSTLSRVQQIGVKYYDEFQLKIPRAEVESISATILAHANRVHLGWHMVIVGGYRRGKPASGDVDVVLSHREEAVTAGAIHAIVSALEKTAHITHTLTLSTANSERGQMPVSWKGMRATKPGSGFDTLDKALVVWQDPAWLTRPADLASNPRAKNPNVHRRVDIIISPWKTAGCAVLGWTSGTTFQRDLRRYCKNVKGLKFDSSGIRSRADGRWVDLEGEADESEGLVEKERRVFNGLGLDWREPGERCTG